jgi:HD superfamily phosphodiesterase
MQALILSYSSIVVSIGRVNSILPHCGSGKRPEARQQLEVCCGAGPHALANILGLIPKEAHRLDQRFKQGFVATLDRDGAMMNMARVRAWIQRMWVEELADTERMAEEEELRQLLAEIEELDRLAADEDGETL